MNTERSILIAFILNLLFSVFEVFGGIFTGSVAIISDAVHDLGDAASIGISFFLEKKSKRKPDEEYTYGYARYSVIGGAVTTLILLFGSAIVIYSAVKRFFVPTEIHYDRMIMFAIIGVCVNIFATFITRKGDSLNQKAVNLHMLEDVLGWAVVLIGAIVMKFTDFTLIDPIMSIGVSLFIMINAGKTLKEIVDLLVEKVPDEISVTEIKNNIEKIDGVRNVHDIHIWSLEGRNNIASMHIITDSSSSIIKDAVRAELHKHKIEQVTIEIETAADLCQEKNCEKDFI